MVCVFNVSVPFLPLQKTNPKNEPSKTNCLFLLHTGPVPLPLATHKADPARKKRQFAPFEEVHRTFHLTDLIHVKSNSNGKIKIDIFKELQYAKWLPDDNLVFFQTLT